MDTPRSDSISLTVGVGASAGGLSALQELVRSLPTDAGFAIVVVQHLDHDQESRLVELLDRHSTLPVCDTDDGQRLLPDTIYVIPPNRYLSIDRGAIRLSTPGAKRGLRKSIDHFFASLAATDGPRCAGIVMSGTGTDGTAGLAAVKAAGGLTIAQEPATAEHASMPRRDIGAAVIDAVLPVELMSECLRRYVDSGYRHSSTSRDQRAGIAADTLASTDHFRDPDSFRVLEQELVPAVEASPEELRSLNEELTNTNAQLKEKVAVLQAAHNYAENFFSSTHIPTIFLNLELRIERYTPAAAQLLKLGDGDIGRSIESAGGNLLGAGLIEDCRQVLADLQPARHELPDEAGRWFIRQVTPYRTEDRRIDGVVVVLQDVTDLKQMGNRAESRERQQLVVANLGMMSLAGIDANELIEHSVRQVAEVLQADLCKVLRYRPETNDLLVIAGVGLAPGVVGQATVSADTRSQAGFTLLSQQPVIVDRLSEETRFTGANLLIDHKATSGMSCLIKHSDPPFGVLAVHTRSFRKFTRDDANFLVSVANLLSTTLRTTVTNERLRDSEEQFRTMANSIPQLAWITDAAGDIIWYNQQWFDFTGTTFEQMRGWGWRDVHHPDHVDRVVTKFRRFIENGSHWEDTFPLRGRDGEYRWFLSRAQPIRNDDGEIVRWFGTNTDITQHRQQEKALRSSEEKLRLAINTNEIGTFEIYLREERTYWDPVLLRAWGVAPDETPTQTIFWEGVHPDDANRVREALQRATDPAGDGHYHATYRVFNRQNGEQSWIEASGQTLFEDGVALRMVGLVIDITERKELEESLKQAVGELQQNDARKNEFLAVLGHELRNPLAAMNNSVDMLSLMPEAVDDVLGIMRNSVRTMGRLLDDLLDLNRISQDKIQLDLQVVDLGLSLRKALEFAVGECEKRQQTLKSRLGEGLFVLGDSTRLEQVFVNLLTNACKYTQQGGRITVNAERAGNEVSVEVHDTGIGIDAANLQRIFDPFFQVKCDGSPTSGLGIGLALSRKLTELHGGTISAASEGHGKGTTFTLRFPVYATATGADDPDSSGSWAVLRPGLAIVLIDDNEDILRTLPGLLESLQCRVRTARTAEFGLELARTTAPDAVLIDIGLPDKSGHEVARKLRADGYEGLLVAISGYGHREARERSTAVGFDYHLAKPAKLKDIASVLARVRKG